MKPLFQLSFLLGKGFAYELCQLLEIIEQNALHDGRLQRWHKVVRVTYLEQLHSHTRSGKTSEDHGASRNLAAIWHLTDLQQSGNLKGRSTTLCMV